MTAEPRSSARFSHPAGPPAMGPGTHSARMRPKRTLVCTTQLCKTHPMYVGRLPDRGLRGERSPRSPLPPTPRSHASLAGLRRTDVVGAFFICGVAFLLAAAAVGAAQRIAPWPSGHWLALHLAFVGGVSAADPRGQPVLPPAPSSPPIPRRELGPRSDHRLECRCDPAGDRRSRSCGHADLARDRPARRRGLGDLGRSDRRRCDGDRCGAHPGRPGGTQSGACFFGLGMIAGSLLARGVAWSHGDLLAAHMALEPGGLVRRGDRRHASELLPFVDPN